MTQDTRWKNVETWHLRKPAVHGSKGLVASQHHAASDAGAAVLSAGGNAMDAALTTSLMIGTVEPWMSGLGGGGNLLYFEAATGTTHAFEFGMRAPLGADPADYPVTAGQDNDLFGWPSVLDNRNVYGPMSIATPGYLAGINAAAKRFASLSFGDLIAPAIKSARNGMAVDWYATLKIASAAATLSRYPESAARYLPGGFVPAGEWGGPVPRIMLGQLAATLETLQERGADDFYHGEVAQRISDDAATIGSSLRAADLAQYQTIQAAADEHRYRDAVIHAAPGMTAGPTLCDTLQRLQQRWQPASGQPDTPAYQAYASSLQEAYEHRLTTMGDLDDSDSPACTTHISAVDAAGNMVSLTQTLLSVFGSKVMLPHSGILMNNGMMWFDPRSGRPNSIAPGKRPLSNMCPTQFTTADGARYALGASGGRRIMPSVMQLISFISDYGMSIDDAMHQGRIDVSGAPIICVDETLNADIAASIETDASVMRVPNGVYPALFACPNIVGKNTDGSFSGGAFVSSPWAAVAAAS